jgi:uncharacterized membrane protein YdjX (TVP38/TMEM64 family)
MLFVVAILVFVMVAPTGTWIQAFSKTIAGMGAWGPVLCFSVVLLVCVAMLPLFPCIVACGVIFGFVPGVVVVMPAALLGALISAVMGRTVLREQVLESMKSRPRWQAVIHRFQERGFVLVILARCVPALPFGMQNCALGAIGISLSSVFLGTLVGMAPAISAGLYIGHTIGDVGQLQEGVHQGEFDVLKTALLVLGGLAIAALFWWTNRIMRAAVSDGKPGI